jgi:hypothetical protein
MELKLHNEEKDSDNLVIYHQNIMSLNRKGDKCYFRGKPHQTSSHMLK